MPFQLFLTLINDEAGRGATFLRFPSFISIKGLFPSIWEDLEKFQRPDHWDVIYGLRPSYIFAVSGGFITRSACVSAHARQLHAALQMAAIISLLRPR